MTGAVLVGDPLLEVRDLTVEFGTTGGTLRVVDGVSFAVGRGETLGLVGESGCGKSVSSLAVMGLIPPRLGRVRAAAMRLGTHDLLSVQRAELRAMRGPEMAMIFQEPMTSLNPAFTVGNQIAESVRAHQKVSRAWARARAVEMLDRVGIPDPARRAQDYPHAFSGGMRQRAMIAMALANDPRLLIADEPTTALDVTIQAQIVELLRVLQRDNDMAIIFVTHDLGVVADVCDRVVVMYAGQVVEESSLDPLFARPRHPYTAGLLASMPQSTPPGSLLTVIPGQVPTPDAWPAGCRFADRCEHREPACDEMPVVWVLADDRGVRCRRADVLELAGSAHVEHTSGASARCPRRRGAPRRGHRAAQGVPGRQRGVAAEIGTVRAVDGIDFSIRAGETLGLVGESGSGKSTVARLLLRLLEPTAGTVRVADAEVERARQARASGRVPRHADGVPGPVLLARSPSDHRRDHRGADGGAPRPEPE